MNWLGFLGGGAVESIAKGVKSVATLFTPDKEEQGKRDHTAKVLGITTEHEQEMANLGIDQAALAGAHAMATAEWNASKGKTGFLNSLVDFLNRLPRPCMALGIIGIFAWTMIDPISAAAAFTTMEIIPTDFWYMAMGS